jgi:hypothetical protein
VSFLPPGNGESFERRDDESDRADYRRRARVVRAVLAAAVALIVLAFAATRGSGHDAPTLPPPRIETTETAEPSATTTTAVATPLVTSLVTAPIEVEHLPGNAIIAQHISCKREDELADDSVEGVQAAVAAENDNPSDPGGPAKPYAHDIEAQSEIVRASIQELHRATRFYADCAPMPSPGSAPVTTTSAGSSATEGVTLPASA